MTFERISLEAGKLGGQPCIRGPRITVATVVATVADGMSAEQIVNELPDLEAEDPAEALRYASEAGSASSLSADRHEASGRRQPLPRS